MKPNIKTIRRKIAQCEQNRIYMVKPTDYKNYEPMRFTGVYFVSKSDVQFWDLNIEDIII